MTKRHIAVSGFMTKRHIAVSGFTLVELLIVIALLAAIILVVITAINPFEQANRSKDTKFNTDAGALLAAIERYNAVNGKFPWVVAGAVANNESPIGYISAGSVNVGICGATCSTDGLLITSEELKSEFRNRDFIKDDSGSDIHKKLWVGKSPGSSANVYVCYNPSSKATRNKACADGDVYGLGFAGGGGRAPIATATCSNPAATWQGWFICLPS